MKIAIVTPVFPPYRGGIGKVAQEDAAQLASLGFDVCVYVSTSAGVSAAGSLNASGALVGASQGAAYRVEYVRPFMRYGLGAWLPGLGRLLRENDLVLLHYPFYGGAEPLWLARVLGGAADGARGKLALTYHMDVVGSGAIGAYMGWHARHVMPRILRAADKVLVTSFDYARNGLLAPLIAAAPARFAELPPSVDTARFAPAPKSPELLAKYGVRAGERVLVQLGGLDKPHYFKGVPVLLEALAKPSLLGARAIIIGDGDLRAGFEARAAELGIADRVVFAGSVSEAALADHLRLGDVFTFPSIDKSEAFGIAALEAASCGLPVVASDLAGVRTVVRDGENGVLVPPNDTAALASAIAALLADEPRRAALGAAGRAMAVHEYGDAARAARWKSLLNDLSLL